MLKKYMFLLCITACSTFASPAGDTGRDEIFYHQIREEASGGRQELALEHAQQFLREYPDSLFIPGVKYIIAGYEQKPLKAIRKYREIIEKYKNSPSRDDALLRSCEIMYLQSDWISLRDNAREGIIDYPGSEHETYFRYYYALALMQTGDLDNARGECLTLMREARSRWQSDRGLLLLAEIHRRTTGYSSDYLYALRNAAIERPGSEIHTSAIYLLGAYYEKKQSYNKSYSAYLDTIKRYPGSPEADRAAERIAGIQRYRVKRVDYFPGEDAPAQAKPSEDTQGTTGSRKTGPYDFFTIAIGPVGDQKWALQLMKLVAAYKPVKSARRKDGYAVYAGHYATPDDALRTKIRLAEDFGINGRIVRVTGNKNKKFIYGD